MLERFDKVVAGESVAPMGFGPPPGGGEGGGRPRGGFGGPGSGFPMFQPPKPIKPFVVERTKSIVDQLAGKPVGQELQPGFGPGGGRGGFGPGMFLARPVLEKADADHDGKVTAEEFHRLGEAWFVRWDSTKTGSLTEDQVRDGLSAEFPPPPGFGPPPGGGPPGASPGEPRPPGN
jgi:hypothetical protein